MAENPATRLLGKFLKEARNDVGFASGQVSERLGWAAGKLTRFESGERVPSAEDLEKLASLYELTEDARRGLQEVFMRAHGARSTRGLAHTGADYQRFVGSEAEATDIFSLDVLLIPEMLQSISYRRECLKIAPGLKLAARKQFVDSLESRKRHVRRSKASLHVLIGEAALHHRVGSASLMLAQIEQIAFRVRAGNVDFRVLRLEKGVPVGATSFELLKFQETAFQSVVYVPGYPVGRFVSDESEVKNYVDVFEEFSRKAESPQWSLEYLDFLRRKLS
jgi:transcriptional regulator with XRE-family HTH domain